MEGIKNAMFAARADMTFRSLFLFLCGVDHSTRKPKQQTGPRRGHDPTFRKAGSAAQKTDN